MKHQQVVPDYVAMVKTSGTCLCLVFSGWVLFKLVQAIFWLPGYLEKNQGRLYKRIEHRSGVSVADGDKAEKSKDEEKRSTVEDDCDDEEKESVQSLEEIFKNIFIIHRNTAH